MKIRVSFKTPDAVDYAIEDLPEEYRDSIKDQLSKWIQYGEYVTIEFDLDKETATVLEQI